MRQKPVRQQMPLRTISKTTNAAKRTCVVHQNVCLPPHQLVYLRNVPRVCARRCVLSGFQGRGRRPFLSICVACAKLCASRYHSRKHPKPPTLLRRLGVCGKTCATAPSASISPQGAPGGMSMTFGGGPFVLSWSVRSQRNLDSFFRELENCISNEREER